MDIGKYIGAFLSKNGYCSLPGLGTLQLEKKGATRRNSTDPIEPPTYNLSFNNVGSIDDKFPHFIAVNENISTNNASNLINTFGREVKDELAAGRPYVIDGLGRFTGGANSISFQALSDLNFADFAQILPSPPPLIDNTRNNKANNEESVFKSTENNTTEKTTSFNVVKIAAPLGLLALLAVGGYFGYNYLQSNKQDAPIEPIAVVVDSSLSKIDTTKIDSTKAIDTSAVIPIVDTTKKDSTTTATVIATPVANGPAMKVILNTFTSQALADAKSKKLTSYGHNTTVVKQDSSNYHVVYNLASTNNTPDKVVDSLRRLFNPGNKNGTVKELK